MFKNSLRAAIGIAFLALLLAAPRPALADCGMGYQMGSNCYPTPGGNNYQGAQGDSNCYATPSGNSYQGSQGGSNCYPTPSGNNYQGSQGGSNCFSFTGGSMCYVNPGGNNPYPSYSPPASGGYGGYGNTGSHNNSPYGNNNGYGNGYNPNPGSGYAGGANYGSYTMYVVRWGDTMRKIADRFGIPLFALFAANRQVRNPNLIFAGQVIYLPSGYGQNSYYMQRQNNYYMQGQNNYYMQGQRSYQMPGQNYGPYGYGRYGSH